MARAILAVPEAQNVIRPYNAYLAAFGKHDGEKDQQVIFGYMDALSDLNYLANVTYLHERGGRVNTALGLPAYDCFSPIFGDDARLWNHLLSKRTQIGEHPVVVRAKIINESVIKKLFPQMSGRFAELGIETLSYITAFDDSTIRVR